MINVTAKKERKENVKNVSSVTKGVAASISGEGDNLHKGSHVAGTLGGRSHRPFRPLQLITTQDYGCLFLFLFLFDNLTIIWLITD